MSDRVNLASLARDCLADSIYGMDTLDLNELRERAADCAHSAADSACIYYSDCLEIISRYEREAGNVEDLGGTYRADQWREAAQAYAYVIAAEIINGEIGEALDELSEAADALEATPEIPEYDGAPRISRNCPHGWAPHDTENEAGVLLWLSGQLDGMNGAAIQAADIWLSVVWNRD